MSDISVLYLWKECPECRGSGKKMTSPSSFSVCTHCQGEGKLPIRYTPEQANTAGYEIKDDDPVWQKMGRNGKWFLGEWCTSRDLWAEYSVILAIPGQGKPDPNWRPE